MKINENVDKKILADHHFAMTIAIDSLQQQAQPVYIEEARKPYLVFKLKVNIPPQVFERLILKPIQDNLDGLYKVSANHEKKTMRLTKVNESLKNANQAK